MRTRQVSLAISYTHISPLRVDAPLLLNAVVTDDEDDDDDDDDEADEEDEEAAAAAATATAAGRCRPPTMTSCDSVIEKPNCDRCDNDDNDAGNGTKRQDAAWT